ncbi:undecaprenyl-diphosphatase [Dysgonomonadaceae bacterium PH5-43]|nr:undecaprenyl-diphosphatase [Dysgonomonadaceae bacterium PH5-43]
MLEQELLLERDLFFFLNGSDYTFVDFFFWLYSYKLTWIPFYFCFLTVFFFRKNWKEIVITLLSLTLLIVLCDQIASGFFKPVFQRFRPTHHPDFMNQVDIVLGYRGGKYGFISSHASNAVGFATFTMLLFRNKLFSTMIIFFAVINAYSRIYLGVHFISDVIVGSLVGILCGYFVYKLYNYARYRLLKINKEDLKISLYSKSQVYFLSGAYIATLISIFVFDNQLVSLFHNK